MLDFSGVCELDCANKGSVGEGIGGWVSPPGKTLPLFEPRAEGGTAACHWEVALSAVGPARGISLEKFLHVEEECSMKRLRALIP
eukprot:859415-Pelagomonas_calceolata.AAC.2